MDNNTSIDLKGFNADQQIQSVRLVFDKIEKTIQSEQSDCTDEKKAFIVMHTDKEQDDNATMLLLGNPKVIDGLLTGTLTTSIKNTANPGCVDTLLMTVAARILSEIKVDNLKIDDEMKKEALSAITRLLFIALMI